jgi:RND family efflux transporter MFP subunit
VKRLVVLLLLAGCGEEHAAPRAAPDGAAVARVRDAGGDAAVDRGFVGVITAAELMDVAPRFEGVISDVKVRAGDKVKAGEVVATMDPAPLQDELRTANAALATAEASRRQAEVEVEDARHKLEVEKASVAAGTSPQQNLVNAQLALKRAQAAVSSASSEVAAERARSRTASDRLADTALRAKFDGTVADRYHDAGSTIGAGTAILRIVGEGDLRLRFAVEPDRAGALKVDDDVQATIDTVDEPVPATVRQVSPTLDPASGMVIVEAELHPSDDVAKGLRPGLAAWVKP